MSNESITEFIRAVVAASDEHGIEISACGCCDSPWLEVGDSFIDRLGSTYRMRDHLAEQDHSAMMVPCDRYGHPVGPPELVAEPGNAPAHLFHPDDTHEVVLDSHGSCATCIDETDDR